MKDYYKILEVNNSASSEVISKVYKILAKKYHPDANPDNKLECEEKFKEISEAYEILSDEQKRKDYDIELENFKQAENYSPSAEEYENLKAYCLQLQDELNYIKGSYYSSETDNSQVNNSQNGSSSYNQSTNSSQAYNNTVNQAYQDAMNKAYNDTYENTLRNLGYRIRYRKTFKQKVKSFVSFVIAFILTSTILFILWQIPAFKNYILSLIILK